MPKMRVNDDAPAFAKRLVALLRANNIQRRGAGAYLAGKYTVSNVTANAWLNGVYKPGIPIATKIATDHKSTLDDLYFWKKQEKKTASTDWLRFDLKLLDRLTPGQKVELSGKIEGWIIDLAPDTPRAGSESESDDTKSRKRSTASGLR